MWAYDAADFRPKPLLECRVRDQRPGVGSESTPTARGAAAGVRLQPRGVRGLPDCAFSTLRLRLRLGGEARG